MLQHREVPTIAVHSQAWWRPFVLGIGWKGEGATGGGGGILVELEIP